MEQPYTLTHTTDGDWVVYRGQVVKGPTCPGQQARVFSDAVSHFVNELVSSRCWLHAGWLLGSPVCNVGLEHTLRLGSEGDRALVGIKMVWGEDSW